MVKYILSCDGGGIRGIITMTFLKNLEEKIGPLYDRFDMFAGTSIGALIITLIGVLKKSAIELEKTMNDDIMRRIFDKSYLDEAFGVIQFKPKYDGKGKRDVIYEYVEDSLFLNDDKYVLVPSYDVINRKSKIYKTHKDKNLKCIDVIDSSTAAPAYFPSVNVSNDRMIDGGVFANNPAMCAYAEAKRLWPNEEIKILSIGTGYASKKLNGTQSWGGIQWITSDLINILMDQKHVDYQLSTLIDKNYFRVNPKLTNIDDELDNTSDENIEALKKAGIESWENHGQDVCDWF